MFARKLNVGVFTQPGSFASFARPSLPVYLDKLTISKSALRKSAKASAWHFGLITICNEELLTPITYPYRVQKITRSLPLNEILRSMMLMR
jgi:hypothetical protein